MWLFICLFLPTFIAFRIHLKYFKSDNLIDYISVYSIYNVIINMSICIICSVFTGHLYSIFNEELFTFGFSAKFLLLSSVLNIIYPVLYKIIVDNFSLKIKVRKRQ